MTVSLTGCYIAAFAVATDDSSTWGPVLSVVPPVSALTMPALVPRGRA